MKHSFRIFIIGWAMIISNITSSYAAGLWLYETATPDMGSASAGRAALATDASTASTNPAGMTLLERSQLLGGLQLLYVDAKFDVDFAEFGGGNGGNAGGWVPAGSFSYAHSVSPDLWLGVSVGSYFGLGLDYEASWAGRYYVTEGEFITIGMNPTIGYRVNDNWSIGAGISALNSNLEQKVAVRNPPLPGLGISEPDGQLKLEDDDWGYGYNFGVLYEVNNTTRLGLTYRSEVEFDYKDALEVTGLGTVLGGLIDIVGLTGSKVDLEMNLPQAVMFSAYHKVTEKLALLGNVGWQEWSSFGETAISLASETSTSLTQDRNFDDTWHFALGVQYEMREPWLLSVGIAYDESPVSDIDRTPDMPLDRQWRYGVGIQYEMNENMVIGCAYEFLDAGDATIEQNRGVLAGALEGDYSSNQIHFFNVNVIRRF